MLVMWRKWMKLKGKKAVVTGANRSIGRAIAHVFAQEGSELVVSYRSDKKGVEETVDTIQEDNGKVTAVFADFSTFEGIQQFYKECMRILGRIDILVNNAAAYDTQGFFDLKPEEFQKVLQISVLAPFFLSQLVAQEMIENHVKGNIIHISSISGTRPSLNRVAHATAKAALNMLTQSMALELASHQIRVNAIAPGYTPYELNAELDPFLNDIPLRRAGLPLDQAQAALFLATEQSSWITGQIMTVDGGHSISL